MSELSSVMPVPTEYSLPYWQSAREHRLTFLSCGSCGSWINYVKQQCPHCGSHRLSWTPCSGKGTLYSYSILHRAVSPVFKKEAPYVLAVIELNEGIKMMSHLVNCDLEETQIGMEVEVIFEEMDEQKTIPYFQPVPRS